MLVFWNNQNKKVKKSKRPDKILVAIVTDGHENDSREYNENQIKKLIKQKEKQDWQFVYLAADQDAFAAGGAIGVTRGNSFSYNNTSAGNAMMFDSLSNATQLYRSVSTSDANYATVSASLFDDSGTSDVTVEGDINSTFTTTDGDKTDAKDEESNS